MSKSANTVALRIIHGADKAKQRRREASARTSIGGDDTGRRKPRADVNLEPINRK